MDSLKKRPDKFLSLGIEYLLIGVVILIILIIISGFAFLNRNVDLGDIGSFFSGTLGVIVALLVAVFTYLAFYYQYLANQKIQEQFKTQQFESQFYKMLDLHKFNVEEIRIPYYDTINMSKKETFRVNGIEPLEPQVFFREIKGRSSFVEMLIELEFCLNAVVLTKDFLKYKNSINHFFLLSYKIFFFGIYSNEVENHINQELHEASEKSFAKELTHYLKDMQEDFRENEKPFYRRNVKIRYIPFQGQDSRLGHYHRHLFQTVKYIVKKEKEGIFEYTDSRQYLRVLRAQLSNAEQLLLYYNYICGFGENWDYLGGKNHQFLTKYRMIHNMPVDRVKIVEKPRVHFKEYICNNCTEDDPLFEWGDS